jgi:ketosteroid isomerase-like protein
MKKLVLCLVLAASVAVQAQMSKTGGGVEKQIAGMEQSWAQAPKASNADAIAPMLADNFVIVFADGKLMNKAQTLDDAKKSKMQDVQVSDIKVTSYGNTAIATGVWKANGTGADGKPLNQHEQFVDTWHKMPDGKWQCIASGNANIQ